MPYENHRVNDKNIIKVINDNVTFKYKDSATKHDRIITEPACQFLWRVLQHVLPKGLRRARNYGFLHGNAVRLGRKIVFRQTI